MKELLLSEREFLEKLLKKKPQLRNGYFNYIFKKKHYKKSRVLIQLYLNKKLENWEIVHHKDGNKINDNIENLEVINDKIFSSHNALHKGGQNNKKPIEWKPANTIKPKIIERIKEVSKGMVKINYLEISRKLNKEGIIINPKTIKRYITEK